MVPIHPLLDHFGLVRIIKKSIAFNEAVHKKREAWQSIMTTGTVTSYDERHGFALVAPDDGGAQVLVPFVEIARCGVGPLRAGQKLSFERVRVAERIKAVSLKLVA